MKRFLTLTAILAVAASLAACGGNNANSGAAANAEATTEAAAEDATTASEGETAADAAAEDETAAEDAAAEDAAADGETADVSAIADFWTLSAVIDADGKQQTFEEYCAANGIEDTEGAKAVYKFNEDGTFVAYAGGITVDGADGTYEFDGTTLHVVASTGDETDLVYSADDDTLTASDAATGVGSVFTRGADKITVDAAAATEEATEAVTE